MIPKSLVLFQVLSLTRQKKGHLAYFHNACKAKTYSTFFQKKCQC